MKVKNNIIYQEREKLLKLTQINNYDITFEIKSDNTPTIKANRITLTGEV